MKKRYKEVDYVKFIMTIIIMFFHVRSIVFQGKLFSNGYLAVDFFFMVSGFLMSLNASDNNCEIEKIGRCSLDYILKKITNLCPNYYLAWAVTFLISHIGSDCLNVLRDLKLSLGELLFLRLAGVGGYMANGPMWYISCMLLSMMVLYPLQLRFKDNYNTCICPIIFCFLFGMTYLKCDNLANTGSIGLFSVQLLRGIMSISIGSFVYYCAKEKKENKDDSVYCVLARIFGGLLLALVVIYMVYVRTISKVDWIVTITFALLLYVLTSYSSNSLQLDRFTRFLSKLGMNIYMMHWGAAKIVRVVSCDSQTKIFVYIGIVISSALILLVVSDYIKKNMVIILRGSKQ